MLKLFYGHGKCNCSLCWHNWTNFDLVNLYTNINEKWTVLRGGSKKLLWILNSYFTIEVWWSPCYQCYCFLFAKWALLHGYTMTCILRGHTNICCVYILEKDLNAYRKPEIYRNHKKSWIFFFPYLFKMNLATTINFSFWTTDVMEKKLFVSDFKLLSFPILKIFCSHKVAPYQPCWLLVKMGEVIPAYSVQF